MSDEEDEEEEPSTTLLDPSNFVPASEQAQGKISKKNDHITISSEEEEEESSPARSKLNKGKGKAGPIDSDAESTFDDLEGEVRTMDDLKVEQPELEAEHLETLRQRLVPIYQQTLLTHTYRCLQSKRSRK